METNPQVNPVSIDYAKRRLILNILCFIEKMFTVPFTEAIFETLFQNINMTYGINYADEKSTIIGKENVLIIHEKFVQEESAAVAPKYITLQESIVEFFLQEKASIGDTESIELIILCVEKLMGVKQLPKPDTTGARKTLLTIFSENQVRTFATQGNNLLVKKNYKNAINAYTMALKYQPTNEVIVYNRALAYYYSKNYETCMDDVETALTLNSDFTDVWSLGGDARMKMHLYLSASYYYEQAVQLEPHQRHFRQKLDHAIGCYEDCSCG